MDKLCIAFIILICYNIVKEMIALPVKYKFNILSALKEKGYNPTRIRKEKIMSESTLQKFRNNEIVSIDNISRLCEILDCQPGDILEYVPDNNSK